MEHMFSIEVQAEYLERMQDDNGSIMEHTTYMLFSFKPVSFKNAKFLALSSSKVWFTFEIDKEPLTENSAECELKIFNNFAERCNASLQVIKSRIYIGFDTNQDIQEIIHIFKEILNDFGYI